MSSRASSFLVAVVCLMICGAVLAIPPHDEGKTPEEKHPSGQDKFIRIQRDERSQPVSLETAIVRYDSASGEGELVVDLISVIHVADRSYYQKLNHELEQYDVVSVFCE